MTESDLSSDFDSSLKLQGDALKSFALGELLEFYRDYLLTIANEKVSEEIRGKCSPSDFVQETFCEATEKFRSFEGQTCIELKEWLKTILLNNITDGYRSLKGAQKRDVTKEVSLDANSFSRATLAALVDGCESPSARLKSDEQSQLLREHLERLPEIDRCIVRLRSLEGLSFVQIAPMVGKSADAVRKIWFRAVEKLSKELKFHVSDLF